MEVVQMTKVDVDRTLTEKTDFVDKIIQFKGINPEKDNYLANIHHGNSDMRNSMNNLGDFEQRQNTSQSHNQTSNSIRANSVPVMTPTSPNHGQENIEGRVSVNSSISTDSGGTGLDLAAVEESISNEREQPGPSSTSRSRVDPQSQDRNQVQSSSTYDNDNNSSTSLPQSKRLRLNRRTSKSSSTSSMTSDNTVTLAPVASQSRSSSRSASNMSSISSAPIVFERERMQHINSHNNEGTPKHSTYNKIEDIHDNEMIRLQKYTVKELKNFLNSENVNYSGLIEKHELYEKAKNLILDRRNNEKILEEQTKNESSSGGANGGDVEKDICKVCWDATINCVLLECGHMCACINCSKKLTECPICRQHVVRCVHVFRV